MPGFRNSTTMGICSRCKQVVLTGYEGGSPFTIDLANLDPVQEVLTYAAKVTTYALLHASDPTHMRVKYRTPKYIGTPPSSGYTVHRAHPCSARVASLPAAPQPVQTRTRAGEYNPVTGMPTNGMLPFIPNDGIEPPFDAGRPDSLPSIQLPEGDAVDASEARAQCEVCGLDVAPGTGAMLFIPGQEPWGCHDQQFCPLAPRQSVQQIGPSRIYMPEDDYEFGPHHYEDYGSNPFRRQGNRNVHHGGTFAAMEIDERRGQGRRYKRTVTVGTGIDEWQDETHD